MNDDLFTPTSTTYEEDTDPAYSPYPNWSERMKKTISRTLTSCPECNRLMPAGQEACEYCMWKREPGSNDMPLGSLISEGEGDAATDI